MKIRTSIAKSDVENLSHKKDISEVEARRILELNFVAKRMVDCGYGEIPAGDIKAIEDKGLIACVCPDDRSLHYWVYDTIYEVFISDGQRLA